MIKPQDELRNVVLAIGLVMAFVFVVAIAIYVIRQNYQSSCSCSISVPISIAALTATGVLVGITTYYFLSKSFNKRTQKIFGDIRTTLDFLDTQQRAIISCLIDNKGELSQSNLREKTGMDAVKLHRKLASLQTKGIITKQKRGMTNQISLKDDLKEVFIQ